MGLASAKAIFWEVDTQRDFLLPGGALYVSGAEEILPSLQRLLDPVRQGQVILVSSADAHDADDAEFREWPPHCVKDTPGAEIVPEGLAPRRFIIPNRTDFVIPADLRKWQQIILQKNTLDVFDNPHAGMVVDMLAPVSSRAADAEPAFVVFGVVTEYCVSCTVEGLLKRGRKVFVVGDAVKSLDPEKGERLLNSWRSRGVGLLSAAQAVSDFAHARGAR